MAHDPVAIGPPRMHRDLLERRQLARQVLDVHSRPAVDVRRELAGEQRDLHCGSTTAPLPTTTTPPSETTKRARSASGSTPISAPSSTHTSLSRIARRTTALRATSTPGKRIESDTSA